MLECDFAAEAEEELEQMSGDPLVAAFTGFCSIAFGAFMIVRRGDFVLPHASRLGFEQGSRAAKLYAIWAMAAMALCVLFGVAMLALAVALVGSSTTGS
jgi:hypothetical protein